MLHSNYVDNNSRGGPALETSRRSQFTLEFVASIEVMQSNLAWGGKAIGRGLACLTSIEPLMFRPIRGTGLLLSMRLCKVLNLQLSFESRITSVHANEQLVT